MDDVPPAAPRRGRLLDDAAIYIAAAMVNAAIPFLLVPFLTRWLGPSDFGVVGLFVALVNVLSVVVGLGTHGLVSVVFYRTGPEALPPQVGASVGIAATMGAASLLVLWLARAWIADASGIPAGLLWTIIVASVGQFLFALCLTVFQTRRQPYRYAAMQIGFASALAASTLFLVGYAGLGWSGRVLAQTLTATTMAVVGLGWLTIVAGITWSFRRWPVGDALAFGLPLLPHAFGAVAMASTDRLALGSVTDSTNVGYYFLGVQISTVLTVFATAINQAWLPWLYERLGRKDQEASIQVVRACYGVFATLLAGGGMLAISAPWLVPLVAGPGYEPAIPLLAILGPAFAFSGMYLFVSGFLFYERRTGLLSMATLLVALVQGALSFALAHLAGAVGVAWATFATYLVYWLAIWVVAQRLYPMPWLKALRSGRSHIPAS